MCLQKDVSYQRLYSLLIYVGKEILFSDIMTFTMDIPKRSTHMLLQKIRERKLRFTILRGFY